MIVYATELEGVVIIEPRIFRDERGYFFESFSERIFNETIMKTRFVQDNESKSVYGVLRGLHYQLPPFAQSKLTRTIEGRIIDIAVDIRKGSPTFGKYTAVELTAENHRQLFIPRGFAHGFIVLSETAIVQYKTDSYYSPEHERSIAWDDPVIGIDWLIPSGDLIISDKDRLAPRLGDASLFDYSESLYCRKYVKG